MAAYHRVYNFSAGPGTLPVPVLERIRDEMLEGGGAGMSVLEMSHRGGPYDAIHAAAEADLRALMGVPEGHRVLFLQGGASLQFTMLAMALGRGERGGDYVVTGAWGDKAVEAARIEGACPASPGTARPRITAVCPRRDELDLAPDAAYVHITSNETIGGVAVDGGSPPSTRPLVCDMSSDILSRPVDVARYGLLYAGAQKNMGPAGATVVHRARRRPGPRPQGPAAHARLPRSRRRTTRATTPRPPSRCTSAASSTATSSTTADSSTAAQRAQRPTRPALLYGAIDGSGGLLSRPRRPRLAARR